MEKRGAGRKCESMRWLAKRLPATRAGLTGFTFPTFKCKRSRAGPNHGAKPHTPLFYNGGQMRKEGLHSKHIMCQHALNGKTTAGGACGSNKFYRPIIRVYPFLNMEQSPIPPYFISVGKCGTASTHDASMCLLAKRLPAARAEIASCAVPPFGCSGAGENNRLHRPIIRV